MTTDLGDLVYHKGTETVYLLINQMIQYFTCSSRYRAGMANRIYLMCHKLFLQFIN